MRLRMILAGAVAAGTLAACAGGTGTIPNASSPFAPNLAAPAAATNAIKNGCFDTGAKSWKLEKGVGVDTKNPKSGAVSIMSGGTGSCKHAAFAGTTKKPAPNGFWGVAQTVKMTAAGKLTFDYWGASTENKLYGSQQVNVVVGGKIVDTCLQKNPEYNSTKWAKGKCSLSKYKGQTVTLEFGVYDNGYDGTYLDWYVTNISLQ